VSVSQLVYLNQWLCSPRPGQQATTVQVGKQQSIVSECHLVLARPPQVVSFRKARAFDQIKRGKLLAPTKLVFRPNCSKFALPHPWSLVRKMRVVLASPRRSTYKDPKIT